MPSFGPPYIGEAHFRHRSTRHILQVSSLSPPPPLYPSFALLRTRVYYGRWRRFCLPSAKYSPSPHGRGFFISSLRLRLRFGSSLRGMASVLSIFACRRSLRCAPVHFFRLRFRSPMPVERRNDAGTYRNPSPRPPPAIISGRGRRSHALGLLPIVGIQPLLAALTTLSVCLGSAITESGWNVATEGFCNTPSASTAPARSAPVRITPRRC